MHPRGTDLWLLNLKRKTPGVPLASPAFNRLEIWDADGTCVGSCWLVSNMCPLSPQGLPLQHFRRCAEISNAGRANDAVHTAACNDAGLLVDNLNSLFSVWLSLCGRRVFLSRSWVSPLLPPSPKLQLAWNHRVHAGGIQALHVVRDNARPGLSNSGWRRIKRPCWDLILLICLLGQNDIRSPKCGNIRCALRTPNSESNRRILLPSRVRHPESSLT